MKNKKSAGRGNVAFKYFIIAMIGFMAYQSAHHSAVMQRGNGSVGGEVLLLFLPLIWWLVESTIKGYIAEQKREYQRIKAEQEKEQK